MKKIFLILLFMAGYAINAQIITVTLSVKGNCNECKKRIENAADIKGVKSCEWNEKSRIAQIIYNSQKVSVAEIEKAIAAKGYDTESEKADDKAYSKLPKCCRYRDAACTEKK